MFRKWNVRGREGGRSAKDLSTLNFVPEVRRQLGRLKNGGWDDGSFDLAQAPTQPLVYCGVSWQPLVCYAETGKAPPLIYAANQRQARLTSPAFLFWIFRELENTTHLLHFVVVDYSSF